MTLIRIYMFLIRIYMFDTVQEKGLAYRREDLKFLPTLNCTRWFFLLFFTQLEDLMDRWKITETCLKTSWT